MILRIVTPLDAEANEENVFMTKCELRKNYRQSSAYYLNTRSIQHETFLKIHSRFFFFLEHAGISSGQEEPQ